MKTADGEASQRVANVTEKFLDRSHQLDLTAPTELLDSESFVP